jgi:hypothetical protein
MSAPQPAVPAVATTTATYTETKDEKRSTAATALPTIALGPRPTVAGAATTGTGGAVVPLRRWVIHLDQPANERWRPLIEAYKHEFQHALTYLTDMLGTGVLAVWLGMY